MVGVISVFPKLNAWLYNEVKFYLLPDTDECDSCSHISIRSLESSCDDGYRLDINGKSCSGIRTKKTVFL